MAASDPAVQWLLASADPSVRYLALTEVLGESARSRTVREARERIPSGPRVRALLRGQKRDGGFGVHPYNKWRGAFWRLVSLVELAVPTGHPRALAALEQVLGWLGSPRDIPTIDGRVRQHATHEGLMLAVSCRLGIAGDPRVRRLVDSLLRSQWPDGGWNCDRRPAARHSSFHETIGPLWGLSEFTLSTSDRSAREAAERAAEVFLSHRMFRSEATGEVVHPAFVKLHHPPFWHYNVLWGLRVLSRLGKIRDPRAGEALDLIESRRGRDGRWRAGGRYWRPPGSRGSNVEVVDWGRRGPSEMITLNALRVLGAAGRLSM